MKRIVLLLAFGLAQGVAFAAAPTPTSGSVVAKTPTDKLNLRLRHQNLQIERDLKARKLTKDQAKSLKAQVETIRKAEIADLKANNSKILTDAQIADLNQQLDSLSKSIPIN